MTTNTILIVDDDVDIRDTLCDFFEDEGYTVGAAGNGREGLQYLREHPRTSLVLLDLMMPVMDGFEFRSEQKRDPAIAAVPVIVMTARGAVSRAEIDVDQVLQKPLKLDKLLDAIRRAERTASEHTGEAMPPGVLDEREAHLDDPSRTVRFSEMFVGLIGHDLRNPLGAITAAADILSLLAEGSEQLAKPVSRIVSNAARMDRMIAQILDFTTIQIGRGISLHRARVDLAGVARTVLEETQRGIQLEVSGDTTGDWDPDRLSQLLSNLTANAAQHSPPESPIQVVVDGTGSASIRLEVRNQGAIPADLLPRIFEPLAGRARRRGSSGLGLGLYITEQIVLAHGGTIRVESDEQHGTRFVIELPRQ